MSTTNNKTGEKNINTNKYIQEKDYEDIIFTTTPMIFPENNIQNPLSFKIYYKQLENKIFLNMIYL